MFFSSRAFHNDQSIFLNQKGQFFIKENCKTAASSPDSRKFLCWFQKDTVTSGRTADQATMKQCHHFLLGRLSLYMVHTPARIMAGPDSAARTVYAFIEFLLKGTKTVFYDVKNASTCCKTFFVNRGFSPSTYLLILIVLAKLSFASGSKISHKNCLQYRLQ